MEYDQKEMKIKIEILTVINRMRILIKYEKDMICFLRLTENSFLAEKRIVTNQIAPFSILVEYRRSSALSSLRGNDYTSLQSRCTASFRPWL